MTGPAQQSEGWAFPQGSRKAHYFVHQTSLCNKWGFYRGPFPDGDPTPAGPDDCAACRRAFDKRAACIYNRVQDLLRD